MIINPQRPEPQSKRDGNELEIVDVFHTLQGEGPFTGQAAVFIRLAGCNLKCPFCFVGNTMIAMADGPDKRIDEITEGDFVLAYDEANGKFVPKAVIKTMFRWTDDLYRIETVERHNNNGKDRNSIVPSSNNADRIFATGEHPFLVRDKGWIKVKDLQPNDVLIHLSMSERRKHYNPMKTDSVAKKMQATTAQRRANHEYPQRIVSQEVRDAIRARMILNNPMKDPEIALKSYLARENNVMSGPEKRFLRYTAGMPIDFVGDGKLTVAHKVPDFKVRGQNKLIEVWAADALHAKQRDDKWIAARRKRFANAGYETMFIAMPPSGVDQIELRKQVAQFIHNGETVTTIEKLDLSSSDSRAVHNLEDYVGGEVMVFNLEVEDLHTYVANSKVVHNCDTDYTSNRKFHPIKYIAERLVANFLFINPLTNLIVITGGEPLRQDIVPLIKLLHKMFGVHIQIESNGVFPPTSLLTELIDKEIVTYIISPKTARISATAELWASAFKYVISADSVIEHDGLPKEALGHTANPHVARPTERFQGKIYVNPMDSQDPEINKANIVACRDSALKFNHVMGIQLHKLVELP